VTLRFRPQPFLDGGAFELSQRVSGNPSGCWGIAPSEFLGGRDGRSVQRKIPFANLPERPVHGLLDEIPFIRGSRLDDAQESAKRSVRSLLVVHRTHRH
jgi:hypothetical protein